MGEVLPYLAVLACPLGMGLCMWLMARAHRGQKEHRPEAAPQSIEALRAEEARVQAEIERVEAAERARNGEPARR